MQVPLLEFSIDFNIKILDLALVALPKHITSISVANTQPGLSQVIHLNCEVGQGVKAWPTCKWKPFRPQHILLSDGKENTESKYE